MTLIAATTEAPLAWLSRRYRARPVDELPSGPAVLEGGADLDELSDDLVEDFAWERPCDEWRPITCGGTPVAAPVRFIDGSVRARTAMVLDIAGQLRPAILGAIGAGAVRLDGRRLRRDDSLRLETALCLLATGMPALDVANLRAGLGEITTTLVSSAPANVAREFEVLRRQTWDMAKARMERAEKEVLLDAQDVPTVVDGLLERRLTTVHSQELPAYGVVKRQLRTLLPSPLAEGLHRLSPGERSPAFVLRTEHATLVTWYVRLSAPTLGTPGAGIIRVAAAKAYLDAAFPGEAARSSELSAVSAWLGLLRCRASSYARHATSLEPIVRLEDQLHALLPPISRQLARLHRAIGA